MPASRLAALAHAAGAHWQRQLRHRARLYPAMSAPSPPPLPVEARLRLVEHQLRSHLLRLELGQPPLAASTPEAQAILEAAQAALLHSAAAAQKLLRALSAAQASSPTPSDRGERLYQRRYTVNAAHLRTGRAAREFERVEGAFNLRGT